MNKKTIIMVSIVICARRKDIDDDLKKNIKETIGNIDYEIIVIDNSANNYTIYEAYNIGVTKATKPYICFMHDDILFHSAKWGEEAVYLLQDKEIGMLGVIGGHYLDYGAHCWGYSFVKRGQVIQGDTINKKYVTNHVVLNEHSFLGNEVATVDGLWMFTKKELFSNGLMWDEESYKHTGFHFYDMDICMQIHNIGLKVCIADNILIEHKSMGAYNQSFIDASLTFNRKWKKLFPICAPQDMSQDIIDFAKDCQLRICNDNFTKNAKMRALMDERPFKFLYKYLCYLFKRETSRKKVWHPKYSMLQDTLL